MVKENTFLPGCVIKKFAPDSMKWFLHETEVPSCNNLIPVHIKYSLVGWDIFPIIPRKYENYVRLP